MTSKSNRTPEGGGAHRRPRRAAAEDRAAPAGGRDGGGRPMPSRWPDADRPRTVPRTAPPRPGGGPGPRRQMGARNGASRTGPTCRCCPRAGLPAGHRATSRSPGAPRPAGGWATRRSPTSPAPWSSPTCSRPTCPPSRCRRWPRRRTRQRPGTARRRPGEPVDPERLQVTVAQLEHALSARVRVEQAIGVLAERHRLRPRQAFELLRSVARASGRRVMEVATEVVDSATNPLLRIPEELAKPPVARRRGQDPPARPRKQLRPVAGAGQKMTCTRDS